MTKHLIFSLFYLKIYFSRLQSQVAQTSTTTGRLEQILKEKEIAVKERDERLVNLTWKLEDNDKKTEMLKSRISDLEKAVNNRDKKDC